MTILRTQTEAEKNLSADGFVDISSKGYIEESEFRAQVAKELEKAIKKGLPFSRNAAMDDFNDYMTIEKNKMLRRKGSVKPEEIPPFKPDWSKYSDLKNWELIETFEKNDTDLSKKNPGLNVNVLVKKYLYKGTVYTFDLSESGPDAIARAKKNLVANDEIVVKGKKVK